MSTTIIAGSRSIKDYALVRTCIQSSGFDITEIVEGEAGGVDKLARRYGEEQDIAVKKMAADWKNIERPDAVIKTNRYGEQYDAAAGHVRNEEMARYAGERNGNCIVIWDGKSPGSADMKKLARNYKLRCYFVKVTGVHITETKD
jgi:hypothetical protein